MTPALVADGESLLMEAKALLDEVAQMRSLSPRPCRRVKRRNEPRRSLTCDDQVRTLRLG